VRRHRGLGGWISIFVFAVACSRTSTPARSVAAIGATPRANATVGGRFRFASAADARALLAARDGFVSSLGPVDRALRLASSAPVDETTHLAFASKQAMDFDAQDEDRLRRALRRLDERMQARSVDVTALAPHEIALVKTTGKEEFDLPYTRGAAIVLPAPALRMSEDALLSLVAHELFHVLSRHSSALRENAYRLIGFEPGAAPVLSAEIEALRITNPDGYERDYQLALSRGAETVRVVPFLLSKRSGYDPELGNSVIAYFQFKLVVVAPSSGQLHMLDPDDAYLRCVGRNSEEVFHPDEIMADNFVRVLARADPRHSAEPTPELVDDLESLLRAGKPPAPKARCRFEDRQNGSKPPSGRNGRRLLSKEPLAGQINGTPPSVAPPAPPEPPFPPSRPPEPPPPPEPRLPPEPPLPPEEPPLPPEPSIPPEPLPPPEPALPALVPPLPLVPAIPAPDVELVVVGEPPAPPVWLASRRPPSGEAPPAPVEVPLVG
jgi:hypothetical protein